MRWTDWSCQLTANPGGESPEKVSESARNRTEALGLSAPQMQNQKKSKSFTTEDTKEHGGEQTPLATYVHSERSKLYTAKTFRRPNSEIMESKIKIAWRFCWNFPQAPRFGGAPVDRLAYEFSFWQN